MMFEVGDKVRVNQGYLDRVDAGIFSDWGPEEGQVYTVDNVVDGVVISLVESEVRLAHVWLEKVNEGERPEVEVGQTVRIFRRHGDGGTVQSYTGVVVSVEDGLVQLDGLNPVCWANTWSLELLAEAIPEKDEAIEFWFVDEPEAKFVGIYHGDELMGFQIDGFGASEMFSIDEVKYGSVKWRYLT